MSLIIAKRTSDSIYIESDTRITNINLEKSNPLLGFLKTIIIHPQICISYAGVNYFAEKVLNSIMMLEKGSLQQLIEKLIVANKESENRTVFILASILNGKPNIFKISNGEIESERDDYWIGDIAGFEHYQIAYHTVYNTLSPKDRIQSAFRSCINKPNLKTIGDFHISVSVDHKINPGTPVFLYQVKLEIQVTEKQEIKLDNKKWKKIPFGTVQGGSHGISYLVTLSPKYHGVAIHFTHGKFGVLFCPQIGFDGIKYTNVDGLEFISKIGIDYKIPLTGFVLTDDDSIRYMDTRMEIES